MRSIQFSPFSRCFLITVLGALVCVSGGCTKQGSGSSDSGGGENSGGGGGGASGTTSLQCGVVSSGKVSYPDLGDGERVQVVSVISNNLLIVADFDSGQNRRLIKLQGLGNSSTDFKNKEAISRIERKTQSGAVFFKATKDCDVVLSNGSAGTVGALLTVQGESLTEDLIENDFAPADLNDACSGSLLGSCLKQLQDTKENQTFGEINAGFLWKPISDKDGNLVIHVYECDTTILVNGQPLTFAGSGNGRCSTFRATRPGCAFGTNISVKIFDEQTGLPYTYQGAQEIIVPNGCERFELP